MTPVWGPHSVICLQRTEQGEDRGRGMGRKSTVEKLSRHHPDQVVEVKVTAVSHIGSPSPPPHHRK